MGRLVPSVDNKINDNHSNNDCCCSQLLLLTQVLNGRVRLWRAAGAERRSVDGAPLAPKSSPPRPPPPSPGWPLIGQQRGQPLLRLAPLHLGLVEAPAQIADDVILLDQALAQHLDFDP